MKINKVLGVLSVLAIIIISCSKREEINQNDNTDMELAKVEYSGCFLNNPLDTNKNLFSKAGDSLYYTIENDTLKLHVMLKYTCCGLPKDSLVIDGDNVSIYIRDTCEIHCVCYCLCQFVFEYSFLDYLGETIHFYVYLKGYDENEYSLWNDIEFNGNSSKAIFDLNYGIKAHTIF